MRTAVGGGGGDWWPVVVCLAAVGTLWLTRQLGRTTVTLAVRRALLSGDPETRRAAVVVAAHHGLARYRRVLRRVSTMEDGDGVLVPLAEAIVDQPKRGGLKCKRLLRWADEFLEAQHTPPPGAAPGPEGAGPPAPIPDTHTVDPLAVVDALVPENPQRLPVPTTSRLRWRALPDQLDALAIVEAVGRPRRARAKVPAADPVEGRVDIEALLDQLAEISRRPLALRPANGVPVRSATRRAVPLGSAGRRAALASPQEKGA